MVFLALWEGETITFETWHAFVSHPAANIALLLFFFSLLMHAWIGGRDVVVDYILSASMKHVLLVLFGLGLVVLGLRIFSILLTVGAG